MQWRKPFELGSKKWTSFPYNNSATRGEVEEKPLSRFWSVLVAFICALALSACAPPAPKRVDQYQVSITQEPAAGFDSGGVGVSQTTGGVYRVTIAAGSAPPDAIVGINNSRTGENVLATLNPDGSFVALIHAQVGDKLAISFSVGGISSGTTYVYVGALNIKNPYTRGGNWYVGQAHFHTTNSDGTNTPVQMEVAYHDAGYDFLISTDHRGTFPYFINPDDGLTPDPDNSASGKDLFWIKGAELGYGSAHMGAWGQVAQTLISFDEDGPVEIQGRIDQVRVNHGLIAINHPNNEDPPYSWGWNDEIKKVKRYSFVEAFNGKHTVSVDKSFEVNHLPTAVDLADEFQQVWWIGTDDCHANNDPKQFDLYSIVVQTDSGVISQRDLLSSADAGNLYIRETGRGPAISSVTVEGNTITLVMADVNSNYDVTWKKRGNEIAQTDVDIDTTASYIVRGDEGYVRAEITRKSDGKRAFTQPLFIANNIDLSMAVTVSSGANAGNLIDNDRSTYWDAQASTASFVADVGKVRLVNAIKIDWYFGDFRRFNYKIETSDTGAFAGEQVEVVRETYDNRSAGTLDFFDEAARYIKVTVTSQTVGSGDTVRIDEVQLFDSSPARTQLYLHNVSGDDTNNGSIGHPWLTFNHAKGKVRPRDTLNFVNTGAPYPGDMQVLGAYGGKNEYATVIYQGDPVRLTEIDATNQGGGIVLKAGASYVDLMYFDIHSAMFANLGTSESSTGIRIMYNKLHDSSAGRGFLATGKFLLAYNLIYGNGAEGVFIYRDGTEAKIYNNVFYGNAAVGLYLDNIYQSTPVVAEVMNNIFAGNAGAALVRGAPGTISDARNCVEGDSLGPWQQTGSLNVAPLFVSPQTGDFRLQAASPCIDAGVDMGLSMDFLGNPPHDAPLVPNSGDPGSFGRDYIDIGAYEYVD